MRNDRGDNLLEQGRGKIVEYDCLRVIATILVVLGHCTSYKIVTDFGGYDYSSMVGGGSIMLRLFQKVTQIIYVFHMPLFVALSGALFHRALSKNKYKTVKQITVDKGKRLMIPFFVVSICYSFPLKFVSGYWKQSANVVRDYFVGQLLVQGNTHLWYCVTLFIIFIVAFFMEKYFKGRVTIKLLTLLIISLVSSKIGVKLFSYICEYTFWFYVGFIFESIRNQVNKKLNKLTMLFGTMVVITVYYVYHLLYGKELFLYKISFRFVKIGLIVVFCLYTYGIAYMLSQTKIVNRKLYKILLNDSFGIYLYSDSWNYVILYVGTMFVGSYLFANSVGATILYCIRFFGTLIVSIMITELFRKCKLKYLY